MEIVRCKLATSFTSPRSHNPKVAGSNPAPEAYAKIRELERALGRKTMEVEILRAAQEVGKKTPSLRRESGR
jgi:hypothetical protein